MKQRFRKKDKEESPTIPWHALPVEGAYKKLRSRPDGLNTSWDEFAARNLVLLLMVLFENAHVFNCRSEYVSAFKVPLKRNVVLVAGVGAALGLHLLSMQIPFMQTLLRVGPVSITEFAPLLVLAASVLLVMEVFKAIQSRNLGRPGDSMR